MQHSPLIVAGYPMEKTIRVSDIETQAVYATLNDTSPAVHGLAIAGGRSSAEGIGGAGDYVVASQATEQALTFHRWGKTQPLFKCRTSEPIGPLVCSPDGSFIVGGGKSGKGYVWNTASGSLLKVWDAHFKAIRCLTMSDDGGLVFTTSEDTMVRAWLIADLLNCANTANSSGVKPIRSWIAHSLPVTGLHIGYGGAAARLVSVSLDRTAKIYELHAEQPICSIRFPSGLSAVSMDAAERRLAVGGAFGDIFLSDLDVVARGRIANRAAICTLGPRPLDESDLEERRLNVLSGHNRAISSLCCSWDSRHLFSASEDGHVRMWDMDSQHCLKTVTFDSCGPVTCLLLLPRPAALLGQLHKVPLAPLQPLKKYCSPTSASSGQGVAQGQTMHRVGGKGEVRFVLPTSRALQECREVIDPRPGLEEYILERQIAQEGDDGNACMQEDAEVSQEGEDLAASTCREPDAGRPDPEGQPQTHHSIPGHAAPALLMKRNGTGTGASKQGRKRRRQREKGPKGKTR